jgi:hypothetical protein
LNAAGALELQYSVTGSGEGNFPEATISHKRIWFIAGRSEKRIQYIM